MKPRAVSRAAFGDAVGELLIERGWSQRDLADAVGVDPAHVCRLLKRGARRRATPELLARVASALKVEPEFFAEYREWCVLEAVRRNPSLRERLFAGVVAPARQA
jgi:transcriptional regulator with XRE-family HTH domain